MKRTIAILLFFVILFSTTPAAFAASREDGVELFFNLDFFNGSNNSLGEAFQRFHMVTLDGTFGAWDVLLTYNWDDDVNSQVSTHNQTPLSGTVQYYFNPKQYLDLTYLEVTNLNDTSRNSDVLRMDYRQQFDLSDQFTADVRIGAASVHSNGSSNFAPTLGGRLNFMERYHLGVNYLTPMDDHIMDQRDFVNNVPLNLGAEFPVNDNVKLRIDYVTFLNKPQTGIGTWLKTELEIGLWKFK